MINSVNSSAFYVYIHKRASCGTVFYVGKGTGNRAWSKSSRNDWWKRIERKHGKTVEIVQDGMSEPDAHLLESWLIAKFRHEGVVLCNLTDGGDGVSGLDHPSKKRIYCSNGMVFDSLQLAVQWLRDFINRKASLGPVSTCANGRSNSAYGFGWSYDGPIEQPETSGRVAIARSTVKTHSIKVYCSNGMVFASSKLAAEWLSDKLGRRCLASHISAVCTGNHSTAYGYSWSRDGFPEHPSLSGRQAISRAISESNRKRAKRVACSNGMVFDGCIRAAEWLKENGWPKASATNISACALGRVGSAYGYVWTYTN